MTRKEELVGPIWTERNHSKRVIYAQRIRRLLPQLAIKLQVDLEVLRMIVERFFGFCGVCLGPLSEPHLLRASSVPKALICGRCKAALDKTAGVIQKMERHRRLDPDYERNQGRIARYINLMTEDAIEARSLPAGAASDLVEDQGTETEREAGDDPDEHRVLE